MFRFHIFMILFFIALSTGCGSLGSAPKTPEKIPYNVTAKVTSETAQNPSTTDDSITISWAPISAATSYTLYWSYNSDITKTNSFKITGITSTSYIHKNLTIGKSYYYRVAAVIGTAENELSSTVNATNMNFVREGDGQNNTSVNATDFGIGTKVMRAQLAGTNDIDYYKFKLTTPGFVTFCIKPEDGIKGDTGTIKVSIVSDDDVNVISSDDTISGEIITESTIDPLSSSNYIGLTRKYNLQGYIPKADTYYYLKIEKSGSSIFQKDYIITSSFTESSTFEKEFNNVSNDATRIEFGSGSVSGQLSGNTDVDYFKFTVPSGEAGIKEFTIQAQTLPKNPTTGFIIATLYGNDGQEISAKTVNGNVFQGDTTTQPYILSATLTENTTYYIKIENGNNSGFRKEYKITIPPITEIEPAPTQAQSVAVPAISASAKPITTQEEATKAVSVSTLLVNSMSSGINFSSLDASSVAKPVASSVTNNGKIMVTVRDMQKKMRSLQKKLAKTTASVTPQTEACLTYGTRTEILDLTAGNYYISYNNCKEFGTLTQGTIKVTGITSGSLNELTNATASIATTTTEYAYDSYGSDTIKQYVNEDVYSMKIYSMSPVTTTGNFASSVKVNGTSTHKDYTTSTSEKQYVENFTMSMYENGSESRANFISGSFSISTYKDTAFSMLDEQVNITFKNLETKNVTTFTTATKGIDTTTVNGTFAMKTMPACQDGTYMISTQTPIVTNFTNDAYGYPVSEITTAGQMTFNGIMTTFNSDGSITVMLNGVPQIITLSSLQNSCSVFFD